MATKLNVGGVIIQSTDLNIEDLKWLYRDFISKHGRIPKTSEGLSKNNLPQQRIIKRIMEENNMSYSEFISGFGKTSHVRSDIRFYDEYVDKFCSIYRNKELLFSDLTNNEYGLPSAEWLIRNCPDKNVKTYADFVRWCGFEHTVRKVDKEFVDAKLIELQNKIGDGLITENHIRNEDLGFSMIVIQRLYGTLRNARQSLGLNNYRYKQPSVDFSQYKRKIDYVLSNSNDAFISWEYIESFDIPFSEFKISHKSIVKAFKDNDMDFYLYLKDKGFYMNQSSFSSKYLFDDGEKVLSSFEYVYSLFLKNELGLKYDVDYKRDVMYKNMFKAPNKRTNCDYVFNDKCLEIAGMINPKTNNWRTEDYGSSIKNNYRDKLIEKECLLKNNNVDHLFLFPFDFQKEWYIYKTYSFLNIMS